MSHFGNDGNEPRSDLFSLRDLDESIPPVEEVLTPPEELRKQRVRKTIVAIATVTLILITGYTAYYFVHSASVESSALAAGDTGRPDTVREALDTLGSSEQLGLRARLSAMLVLSGDEELPFGVTAMEKVPEDDEHEASERLKAETYLALARGDAVSAANAANRLVAAGTFAAESAYAKSLAAYAAGDTATAVSQAELAVQNRSEPRYAGQLAAALALAGDAARLNATIDAQSDPTHPALLVAKARGLALLRREGASEVADAVLAADSATSTEKAWAHWAKAAEANQRGHRASALEALNAAMATPPPGDQEFRWRVAEAAASAGSVEVAHQATQGLDPNVPIPDSAIRGRARAAMALAAGDAAMALQILSQVPGTAEAHMLAGRAHEARGDHEAAATAYGNAGSTSGWEAPSLAGRARAALAQGQAEAAVTFAKQALDRVPHHPAFTATAVAAMLAAEQNDDAMALVDAAIEAGPEDVQLLVAKGDVLLAMERYDAALPVLRRAAELDSTRAETHAKRGQAARQTNELAEARTAFSAALEIEEANAMALVGLFALNIEENRLDDAKAVLERIDAARIQTNEVHLLRVRYLVASGAGMAGTRAVFRAMRRRGLRGNGYLRFAVAELYTQSERYRQAVGMYTQAQRFGYDATEVAIGKALAWALEGRADKANEEIQLALESAMPEGATEASQSRAAEHPRLLVARGRIEYNLGRFQGAGRYAARALEAEPGLTEAHLLKGGGAVAQPAQSQR